MSGLRASMHAMGRHTAADRTSVHPIVAEGLARRPEGGGAQHSAGAPAADEGAPRSGEIGWPAPPHKSGGLGWPGDLPSDGIESAEDGEEPAPAGRRGRQFRAG